LKKSFETALSVQHSGKHTSKSTADEVRMYAWRLWTEGSVGTMRPPGRIYIPYISPNIISIGAELMEAKVAKFNTANVRDMYDPLQDGAGDSEASSESEEVVDTADNFPLDSDDEDALYAFISDREALIYDMIEQEEVENDRL
jgi:hypothetical protein